MAEFVIGPWDAKKHVRDGFSCGQSPLDDFLLRLVNQYEKRKLGKTFVATEAGATRVAGYYTLASSAVAVSDLPANLAKKLPKHPVPTVLLGRLAVDVTYQGQGLGGRLLVDAVERIGTLERDLGIHAIEVDAIDAAAKRFYEKVGFVALLDSPNHLYLPMATVNAVRGG